MRYQDGGWTPGTQQEILREALLGSVPHFNLPRLPLPRYPRWGVNILHAWRVAIELSEDFPIAVVVLALDPTRAHAVVGSRCMMFDSASGGVSVRVPSI